MTWLLAGLLFTAPGYSAIEPHPLSLVSFAQLKYAGGQWNPRPHALRRLSFEVEKRTSIVTAHEAVALDATDPKLQDLPILYWTGEGAMSPLPVAAVSALRRFIKAGGLMFIDAVDEAFESSVRHEVERVLPESTLGRLPDEHVLFKSFYLIMGHGGRVIRRPAIEGIVQEDRLVLVMSPNDHGGAWSRDDFGHYDFEVEPGGETQREMAVRFGINLLMYALCLDYKEDQVHIPFIMRRRR
jgi:Domain of unknown function (DUF4159)